MRKMSANEAKSHFGHLLDTARREPVAIEKHGRPVVVVLSKEDFDDLEAIKLGRLRAEVRRGIDDIERGDVIETDEAGLDLLVDEIMTKGRPPAR